MSDPPPGNLLHGRRGAYRLLRVVARGGQATVHEGRDAAGGPVAIKRLKPEALARDPHALARFQRELDLLLAPGLTHPGLVRLRDHGVDPLGVPFLVSELLADPCPLDVAFLGRDLPARVRLVREAAAALGALHARGIVHRDVTPENVLLDAEGRVRVTDLGLATRPHAVQAALTGTGQAVGTPGYVAPEVGLTGSREATPAVDVWGLGVLLFQALSGQHPFPHGFTDQLERLRAGPPSPRALAPDVPEALDEVCRRALAPLPAERHPDGTALAAALDQALAQRQLGPAAGESGRRGQAGPARVGRWTILGLLGAGAMGRVLRARDEQLGREVALKLLHADASPTCRARFQREVLAASQVRHPALVNVHEAGEVGGQPYLVMELVQGTPLDHLLEKGPLEPLRAARLTAQLARGVAALHAAGVLHRDLKPGNVLLGPGEQPRLVDFGVALLRDEGRLSRTREVVGTPMYMAPEQLEGPQDDPRVDVYGLGAILFHCLAGSPLGASATSLQELLLRKARPVAPSTQRPPGTTDPAGRRVDDELDAICLGALAPRREGRYPGAAALAEALEAWAEGEPVVLPADPGARTARALTALLTAAAVLALVLAGWAVARGRARGPSREQLGRWAGELEAQGRAGALADLRLPGELEPALTGLDPDQPDAPGLWAWVGLARLARGDEAGAEAARRRAEAAGDGPARDGAPGAGGPPGRLLEGGLLCRRDPARALAALDRAERLGLRPPELFRWRAAALLAGGVEGHGAGEAALALAEHPALREAGGVRDELRVLGLAALGRRDEALAAAARLGPDASPRARWTAGVLLAEAAGSGAALAAAARRLEALERPPGPPTAREQALAARVQERAAPLLAGAVANLRRLDDDEAEVVCLALRLRAALALTVPPPAALREDLAAYLCAASLTGLAEAEPVALAAVAACPDDMKVLYAAATCANRSSCPADTAARMLPLLRRAVERCPLPDALLARLPLGRALAGLHDWEGMRENSRLGLRAAGPAGAALPGLSAAQADELRSKLLLLEGQAERAQDRLPEALACFERAWALPLTDRSELRLERLRTLLQLDRQADARALARDFALSPQATGGWQRHLGELAWKLLRAAPEDLPALTSLAESLAGDGSQRDGAAWLVRLAWLRWRQGDRARAAAALESAAEAPATGRRGAFRVADLTPLIAGLRAGEDPGPGLERVIVKIDGAADPGGDQ